MKVMQMQSNWQFYIPEDKAIPTDLCVKKDNISVYCNRCNDGFAYEFNVYGTEDATEIENIVNDIANLMVSQSWDHGAEWRITDMKQIEGHNNSYRVDFRIKDSW